MVTVLLLLLLYRLNMSDLDSLIMLRLALQLDHFFITDLCEIEKEKHNFCASSILQMFVRLSSLIILLKSSIAYE